MNYISQLQELALGSRLKQLSDVIMSDGKLIYLNSGVDFDPTWFPVFKLLSENSPLGVVEIAEKLGVSHPHVVQVIRALEKKDLIINEVHPQDRRKRSIRLAEKGEKMLPELKSLWQDIDLSIKKLLNECRNNLLMGLTEVENGLSDMSLYRRVENSRKQRLMSDVSIVKYSDDLAIAFKELNLEWLEKYFTVELVDVEVLDNPADTIMRPGGEILFAIVEGKTVGTCALIKKGDRKFELSKMAVTESAQGLQIGKKLCLAIIELAKSKGTTTLYLESNRKLIPALSLYRKLGFVEMPHPNLTSVYTRSDIYMELIF